MIISPIRNHMRRFFAARAPRQDEAELNLRNVYIFFSRGGALFAALLVCTFIAGINYGNNLVLGLCFYLASIWVISLHLTFAHVSGLQVALKHLTLTEAGTEGVATITLNNDKGKPSRQLRLRFDDAAKDYDPTSSNLPAISPSALSTPSPKTKTDSYTLSRLQGKQEVTLPIYAPHRGKIELPRLIISTIYPLGIMRAWSYVYFARPLWAYPKPLPFEMQAKQVIQSDDANEVSLHSTAGQNDFEMLDEFVEGESLARVSWSHLARGQGMLSKHFADPLGQEQRLDYADMPASTHEEKLSQLAFGVLKLSDTAQPFQLNLPNDTGEVGQGEAFMQACLLRLATCP